MKRVRHLGLRLVFRAEPGLGVVFQEVLREELILVGPPAPAEGRAEITLSEVSRIPLLLPSRQNSLRELIDTYARRHAVELTVLAEVDAMPQLRDLAITGAGYTILSYASVRNEIDERRRSSGVRLVEPVLLRSCYLGRSATAPTTRLVETVEWLIKETVGTDARGGRWPPGCLIPSAAR